MAVETYGVLGQIACAATTLETVYTVVEQAVLSTIVLCNRSGAGVTYRLAIAPAGAADTPAHYLAYGAALDANTSERWTIGVTLGPDDEVRVWASAADVSVSVFGAEVTA